MSCVTVEYSQTNNNFNTRRDFGEAGARKFPRHRQGLKRHHKKVHSGCFSCKRRRVKCDEVKPICRQCLRNKLECTYPTAQRNLVFVPQYAILPVHYSAERLDFFIKETVPTLSHFDSEDGIVSTFQAGIDCNASQHASKSYQRFWNNLVLPLAYTEPLIFELIALIGASHRLSTIDEVCNTSAAIAAYSRVLRVMSRLVEQSADSSILLTIGMMVFSAFESLHAVALGELRHAQNKVHYLAAMRLLKNCHHYHVMRTHILPIMRVCEMVLSQWQRNEVRHIQLILPSEFSSHEDAKTYLIHILSLHATVATQVLDLWASKMLQYYQRVKIINTKEQARVLKTMSEFQLMRTLLDFALVENDPEGKRGSETVDVLHG